MLTIILEWFGWIITYILIAVVILSAIFIGCCIIAALVCGMCALMEYLNKRGWS